MTKSLRLVGLVAALGLVLSLPAQAVSDRTLAKTFPLSPDTTLRLANLAGPVQLVPGGDGEVKVEARIFAEGSSQSETRKLLDGMSWIESRDREGRPEWALSYPVKDYRGFAFPGTGGHDDPGVLERLLGSWGLSGQSTSTYLGQRVSVYGAPSASVPILYAELKITVPRRGKLVVRNVVGPVGGGLLAGNLVVDTGSGAVKIDGFEGDLYVDTGSGSVKVGASRGETKIDTGSGSITVGELVGNGLLDTGSGSVRVDKVAAGTLRIDTGSGSVHVQNGHVGTLEADTGSGSIRVIDVEVESFSGDTGSGGVTLQSSLAETKDVRIDTGSGSVHIVAGADASFDLSADQGSGSVHVGYADAVLKKAGHKVVGAERGSKRTRIVVETGSGSCTIEPKNG